MSPRRVQVRHLLICLDRGAKATVGRQLEEQLREAIRSGRLSAEQRLPSTRMLAQDLGVSRGVVVRAYAQLAAEGYLLVGQRANPSVGLVPTARRRRSAQRPEQERRWEFDLRPERPDLSLFPRREWARSLCEAVRIASNAELGYIDRRGLLWTREELAAYLSRARGAEVDPECVVVTAGSTHALTLIARTLLLQEQKVIAFENPTHRVLQRAVFRTGLEPVGVPVDENGLRVDELELSGARCVLVSPAHQFPLGVALAVERRTQLLEWAERSDGVVIEDDYDAEFRYDRAPVGSLQGLAPERVVYIGSTSKTLAPALRLGWAVLPAALVEPFSAELLASTLHMPALEQLAFADFVSRGELDRHMYRARAAYRRRRDIAITVLADQLPELPIRGIGAGLHLVAELSTQTEEDAAWEKATAAGIALETLSSHALPGYSGPRGLLIGFAATSEPTIPLAIRALAKALNQEG